MGIKQKIGNLKRFWPIGLIFLLTILAVWSASSYLSSRTAEVEERLSDQAERSRMQVVVPMRDLAVGEVLDLNFLVLRSVPREYVNQDVITQETVDRYLGKKLTRPVSKGTPLLLSFIAAYEFKPFSSTIEPGTRAITLPIDEINSVSGMLIAGDKIDLLVMTQAPAMDAGKTEMQLVPLLQDITVQATGTTTQRELVAQTEFGAQQRPGSRSGSYNTVTISIPPRDAQRVVLAQQMGRIVALLRRPDDPALYGERLLASEIFGKLPEKPAEIKPDTVSYLVGGSLPTGSQGIVAEVGRRAGGPGASDAAAMQKLMEVLGAAGQ
jgi:pilus assembly protein CpaB